MFKRFALTLAFGGTVLALMSGTAGATNTKVNVCHATSSLTNPYVLISVSEAAWLNAHSDHEDDALATELEVVVAVRGDQEVTEIVSFCPGPELIPGPAGPRGPVGPKGDNGIDGTDGDSITGPAGKDGADGKDGANGLNAVQHNCVSPDGYLYSHSAGCRPLNIVGEAGPQGERGEIGPQGPAGAVVSAASVENTPTTTAPVPASELAYTGSNNFLWVVGIGAIVFGAAAFGIRRHFA